MRKANVSLTMDNRLDICNKKKSRPTMTNDDLAHWAKEEFNLLKLPSASTISKILKRGSQGLIKPDEFKSRKRARKGKWPVSVLFSHRVYQSLIKTYRILKRQFFFG